MARQNRRALLAKIGAKPPANPNQLALAAKRLGTTTSALHRYFAKFHIGYPRKIPPLTEEQRIVIEKTFAKNKGFLKKLMQPHLRNKVPEWFLNDLVYDATIRHIGEFDPMEKVSMNTWILNGWKAALEHATSHFLRSKKRTPQQDIPDYYPAKEVPLPVQAEQNEIRSRVQEIVKNLSPQERNILQSQFGLNDSPVLSQEEIGKKLGLTKEGVRKIKNRALTKIRIRLTPTTNPDRSIRNLPANFKPEFVPLLSRLPPLEYNTLHATLGLGDRPPQSIEQTARTLKIPVQRAKQAFQRGIKKLSAWTAKIQQNTGHRKGRRRS